MNQKKGLVLAIFAGVLSGFSVFINKIAQDHWGDSSVYTTEKNIVVALLLSVAIFGVIKYQTLQKITAIDWLKIILIGLIGGAIPFVLFFKGLSQTGSASAGFWNKTLFIWVAVLAIPILKEKLGRFQIFALGLIIFGNLSLILPVKIVFNQASILILSATVIWATEYILAKKFMKNIASTILVWGRMFFGSIFLIIYLSFIGQANELINITSAQLPWLAVVGIMLFMYVVAFYGAIKRLPVTVVASIITIASPITTLLNNVIYGKALSPNFFLYALLILVGVVVIFKNNYDTKTISRSEI